MVNWPARFEDVAALEEFMTRPSPDLERELAGIDEIMVLGVGGKMGPTLARLARRAGKRVIGVARFSEKGLREKLEGWGIECVACDLLDREQLERLPPTKHVVFMAGHADMVNGRFALLLPPFVFGQRGPVDPDTILPYVTLYRNIARLGSLQSAPRDQ